MPTTTPPADADLWTRADGDLRDAIPTNLERLTYSDRIAHAVRVLDDVDFPLPDLGDDWRPILRDLLATERAAAAREVRPPASVYVVAADAVCVTAFLAGWTTEDAR